MWRLFLGTTVSLATFFLGIWTGGNPETVCNGLSGAIDYNSCMDSFGQIINITNGIH